MHISINNKFIQIEIQNIPLKLQLVVEQNIGITITITSLWFETKIYNTACNV